MSIPKAFAEGFGFLDLRTSPKVFQNLRKTKEIVENTAKLGHFFEILLIFSTLTLILSTLNWNWTMVNQIKAIPSQLLCLVKAFMESILREINLRKPSFFGRRWVPKLRVFGISKRTKFWHSLLAFDWLMNWTTRDKSSNWSWLSL